VCEANLAGSFEGAARLLRSVGGLELSAKRVQLITERIGQKLVEERDEATERFFEAAGERSAAPGARLMVITADGGRLQTRQPDGSVIWREDKVGAVYEAFGAPERSDDEYQGPKPIARSVVATLEPWESLGDHLSALADRRG